MDSQIDISNDLPATPVPVLKPKLLGDVIGIGNRGKAIMNLAREKMLAPDSVKTPPLFTVIDIASVTGVHRSTISKAIQKQTIDKDGFPLPRGSICISKDTYIPFEKASKEELQGNERRYFTCDEAARLIKHFSPKLSKPKGVKGAVIVVSNYKGGVAKTVSSVCLAQALASRGQKVLCLDLDPQGSMTTLYGYLHVSDVAREDTAIGLFMGETTSLKQCIRSTYWPNIDLIPASSDLQGSEYAYRELLNKDALESVGILSNAIQELMDEYDVCIIDTPPSLNSLTNAALFAADGVVMPIPASNLEVASAVQFWDMYSNICSKMPYIDDRSEVFSFVRVILPKMENTISCRNVRGWIQDIYGEDVSPYEIPKSTAVARAADAFGTVFDVSASGNKKLFEAVQPVKKAYENIAIEIEGLVLQIWDRREKELG